MSGMSTPAFKAKLDKRIGDWLLRKLAGSWAKPRRWMSLATGEVAKLVKDNFRRLNTERMKHGHPFYKTEGAEKTTSEVSKDGASGTVKVNSVQMAHKLKGGVVKPKKKFLAIPVSEWAKWRNQTPGDIFGIELFISRKGTPFLAREGKDGTPLRGPDWILVRSVTHRSHPEVLPPKRDVDAVVRYATRLFDDAIEKKWIENT